MTDDALTKLKNVDDTQQFTTCFHIAHCGLYPEPKINQVWHAASKTVIFRSNMYIYCTALMENLACTNLPHFTSSGIVQMLGYINEIKLMLGIHDAKGESLFKVEEWYLNGMFLCNLSEQLTVAKRHRILRIKKGRNQHRL